MEPEDRRRDAGRFAAAEAARLAVAQLARSLKSPPLVLKGVWLVHVLGRDALVRPLSDVDLLVSSELFEDSTRRMEESGWRLSSEEPGGRERVFLGPGPPVDLHQALFPKGMFELESAEVLARASLDTRSFGAPVLVPHPLDALAHLIGHAALTFLFEQRLHHPEDFAFIARRASLETTDIARHLKKTGLETAARYVLPLAGDEFSKELLEALGPAPLRSAFAFAIRTLVPRLPRKRGLGLLPVNLLHRPPDAVLRQALRLLRRRLKR